MSIFNCHKQEPQPWMSYISRNKITYPGGCCPTLITDIYSLLPFQIISEGDYVKSEISVYGSGVWSDITIPITTVLTEGFYIHSYDGTTLAEELECGPYEFRVTAGEVWWFEPFMVEDFEFSENAYKVRDLLMTALKFSEQQYETVPLIAPCDSFLPFMYTTENPTTAPTYTLVAADGTETVLTITVTVLTIAGRTYYIHDGECLYPFLTCGQYYIRINDGAFVYYSVPFNVECGIDDIADGYRALRDFNGCVMRDIEGNIIYEECSDIPEPEPPIEEIKYGFRYNWYAANDARNIAASEWRLPSMDDYEDLILTLDPDGGLDVNTAGGDLKETGTEFWNSPNTGATNISLFNARGGGVRSAFANGAPNDFDYIGLYEFFWTTHDAGISGGYDRGGGPFLLFNSASLVLEVMGMTSTATKLGGASIRLIRNITPLTHGQTGTYVGNDGKVYRTICIGAQEWLADNLCETLYRDGSPIPEVTDAATWAALTTGARCSYDNDESNAFTI